MSFFGQKAGRRLEPVVVVAVGLSATVLRSMGDDGEAQEVKWLSEQFNPASGSHVAKGTYIRIQQAKEKRTQADAVREQRKMADQLGKDRQAQRKAEVDALRAKRGERDQEAVNRNKADKNSTAEQMKAERKAREEQKKLNDQKQLDENKARTVAARARSV